MVLGLVIFVVVLLLFSCYAYIKWCIDDNLRRQAERERTERERAERIKAQERRREEELRKAYLSLEYKDDYAKKVARRSALLVKTPPLHANEATNGFTVKTVTKDGRSHVAHSSTWEDTVNKGGNIEDGDVAYKEITWTIKR